MEVFILLNHTKLKVCKPIRTKGYGGVFSVKEDYYDREWYIRRLYYMELIYYLDTKIPLKLKPLVKGIYLGFLDYIYSKGFSRVDSRLVEGAVKCFCYNLLRGVKYNSNIRVSLDKNNYNGNLVYNGRKVKRTKVSYKYTKLLLEYMELGGYIHLKKGGIDTWFMDNNNNWVIDKSSQTIIERLTPLDKALEVYSDKVELEVLANVVVLKDSYGKEVQYNMTEEIKEILQMLDTYNELALNHEVKLGDKLFEIQGRKVFNNSSFEEGGRTYYSGGSVQQLNTNLRTELTIDGDSVSCLDYKALHPSICAEIQGLVLGDEFDPYGIKLKGWDNKLVRSLSKVIMLVCINASNYKSAIGAITSEIANDCRKWKKGEACRWEDLHRNPDPFPVKNAVVEVINRNSYLVPYFHTGYGVKLQNIDSKILDNIVQHFLQEDELVLLVHDEIICRESIKEDVLEVMYKSYKKILGSDDNCKVEEK